MNSNRPRDRGKSNDSGGAIRAWKKVDGECRICGHKTWCQVSSDEAVAMCRRDATGAFKSDTDSAGAPYHLHWLISPPDDSPEPIVVEEANGEARELADADVRHRVYSAMLDTLSLSANHLGALIKRGLPAVEITRRQYRTFAPKVQVKLAAALHESFGKETLLSVPGFFVNPKSQLSTCVLPGLLIPIRDAQRRIVALKVRPDKRLVDGTKYLWVSSKSHGGPGPGAQPHVPLGIDLPIRTWRLTEGELKADVATVVDGVPTISAPGASIWKPCIPILKAAGCKTVRLAFDADAWQKEEVGRAMGDCFKALKAEAFAVEVERWDPAVGKGIDDVLVAGGAVEVLTGDDAARVVAEVAPEMEDHGPASGDQTTAKAADVPTFANYREVEIAKPGKNGERSVALVKVALRAVELDESLAEISPGWPKRVGNDLFVEGGDHKPRFLETSTQLFAHIDGIAQTAWTKGARFIPQERYFEHQRTMAERFEGIETLPHFPSLPGSYYMHRAIPRGAGARLDELLGFYCPLTPADRELLRAFVMTAFWGGKPGSRPAWLFTGPDDDPEQGRGIGKTETPDSIAQGLAGGYLDISPNDDMENIKKRLLSSEGMQARFIRLDNVKTLRLSWGELENLITVEVVSGHRMFKGEGKRPNNLTCYLTLNGASLSKDMAQRSIVVKLARPRFSPTWSRDVRAFIECHRWEIIADVRQRLEDERGITRTRTRWAAWEAEVLAQTDMLEECQGIIVERQGAIDDDTAESDLVASYFASRLRDSGHDPDTESVIILSKVAADWLSEASRKNYATNAASTHIKGLGIPNLKPFRDKKIRGWTWTGEDARPGMEPVELRGYAPRVAAEAWCR